MKLRLPNLILSCTVIFSLSGAVLADSKSELEAQQSKKKSQQSQQAHAKAAQQETLLHAQQQHHEEEEKAKENAKKSAEQGQTGALKQGDALKTVSGASLPQR